MSETRLEWREVVNTRECHMFELLVTDDVRLRISAFPNESGARWLLSRVVQSCNRSEYLTAAFDDPGTAQAEALLNCRQWHAEIGAALNGPDPRDEALAHLSDEGAIACGGTGVLADSLDTVTCYTCLRRALRATSEALDGYALAEADAIGESYLAHSEALALAVAALEFYADPPGRPYERLAKLWSDYGAQAREALAAIRQARGAGLTDG